MGVGDAGSGWADHQPNAARDRNSASSARIVPIPCPCATMSTGAVRRIRAQSSPLWSSEVVPKVIFANHASQVELGRVNDGKLWCCRSPSRLHHRLHLYRSPGVRGAGGEPVARGDRLDARRFGTVQHFASAEGEASGTSMTIACGCTHRRLAGIFFRFVCGESPPLLVPDHEPATASDGAARDGIGIRPP
jgi:hypothetical protein